MVDNEFPDFQCLMDALFRYLERLAWFAGPMDWFMEDGDMHYALIGMVDQAFEVLVRDAVEPAGSHLRIIGLRGKGDVAKGVWLSCDNGASLLYDIAIDSSGAVSAETWDGACLARVPWRRARSWRFYSGVPGESSEIEVRVGARGAGSIECGLDGWII